MENNILYIVGGILLFILIGRFVLKFLLKKTFRKFGLDKSTLSQMSEKASHLYQTENLQNATINTTSGIAQIEYSDYMNEPKKDTTGWERGRVYVDSPGRVLEVVNNGDVEGYLLDILVRYGDVNLSNKIHPLGGLSIVRNCYIPKSHLHSFGKYTPMIVLYNPKNPKEITPDPKNESWHYELKN